MKNKLKKLFIFLPLTLRGGLAIVLAMLALKFIALPQMDLVTFTLAGPLLALALILALSTIVMGLLTRKAIEQTLNLPTDQNYSNKSLTSSIKLKNSNIPPFYTLKIKKNFSPKGAESFDILAKGKESKEGYRLILDSLRFPHRGVWNLESLDFELGDIFGFTSFRWETPINIGIEVSPPPLSIKPLPVIASSSRAGDEVNLPHDKSGDLFDTKQYDPSDGVKRILWKTYARSGELYVRQPEPAVIPEGEVAIFLVADRYEDHVASAALSYVEHLISNDIVVLFGTDGGDSNEHFCSKKQQIESMVRVSATSKIAGTGEGFLDYISQLESSQRQIRQILVFASEAKIKEAVFIKKITELAALRSAEVSFARVPESFNLRGFNLKGLNIESFSFVKRAANTFLNRSKSDKSSLQLPLDVSLIDVESGESFVSRV